MTNKLSWYSRLVKSNPVPKPGSDVEAEAAALGLTYNGPQRSRRGDILFHLITDPDNMSTFAVRPHETVAESLARHRQKWEGVAR